MNVNGDKIITLQSKEEKEKSSLQKFSDSTEKLVLQGDIINN